MVIMCLVRPLNGPVFLCLAHCHSSLTSTSPILGRRLYVKNLTVFSACWLCGATMAQTVALADACVWGTRTKARMVHPGKLMFCAWAMQNTEMILVPEDVPQDHRTNLH